MASIAPQSLGEEEGGGGECILYEILMDMYIASYVYTILNALHK